MKAFFTALVLFNIVPLHSMIFNKPCETIMDKRDLHLSKTESRITYPIQNVKDVRTKADFRLGIPEGPDTIVYTREHSIMIDAGASTQTTLEIYKFRTTDGSVKDIYQGLFKTKVYRQKPKESFFNAQFIIAALCLAAGIGGYHLAGKIEARKLSSAA